jgi:hypothetical protein
MNKQRHSVHYRQISSRHKMIGDKAMKTTVSTFSLLARTCEDRDDDKRKDVLIARSASRSTQVE